MREDGRICITHRQPLKILHDQRAGDAAIGNKDWQHHHRVSRNLCLHCDQLAKPLNCLGSHVGGRIFANQLHANVLEGRPPPDTVRHHAQVRSVRAEPARAHADLRGGLFGG